MIHSYQQVDQIHYVILAKLTKIIKVIYLCSK